MVLLSYLLSSFLLLEFVNAGVSTQDWVTLNHTVGGRLHAGVPFAQPCFSILQGGIHQAPNEAQCAQVQSRYIEHLFRSDNFGAYQNAQWETCQTSTDDQCLLDDTDPQNPAAFSPPAQCSQGSVPSFYINVTGPNDVVAAYTFSKKNNVPLTIKNSGHDYIGRSSGPGTLALWTHNLKEISLNRSFVPEGCSGTKPTTAVTLGAGQQFQAVYDFAAANNVTIMGGADPSVGPSGGWIMGGGHSALSPSMGLGVDRVLQFKIVTPDGQYRVANKCQNKDLFWALRGGGGGTFGVVLESTHLATPQVQIQALLGTYNSTKENTAKLVPALMRASVQFATDGWGGYILPPNSTGIWANPILNHAQATKSAQAVIDAFTSVGGKATLTTMNSYTEFFNAFIGSDPDPVGVPQALTSRLITADKMTDEAVIQALTNAVVASEIPQILAVGPYAFKGFDPEGTSVTPVWRQTVWHFAPLFTFNYNTTKTQRNELYKEVSDLLSVVRKLTPEGGAYSNEADVYEPNFTQSFWGNANYAKLLAIKRKYDPEHLLDCWHCVGWKGAQNPSYKCYPNISS